MKVEEIYTKESYNQVGVTLQRVPFETQVDVLPQVSPFEVDAGSPGEVMAMMSELTSSSTEEMVKGAASYRCQDTDEEFLAIPLKRVDSGPHEHCMLMERPSTTGEPLRSVNHQALLDEIDDPILPEEEIATKGAALDGSVPDKAKATKKGNTLTRMLKGIRLDKESTDDAETVGVQKSLSKIFQRMNPVGKVSRENFNKAIHRIGDALQKKGDERPPVRPVASANSRLIGENSFKFKPTPKETDRAPATPN